LRKKAAARERLKEKDLWAIIKDDLAQINMRKKLITLRGLNATLSSYHPQKKRERGLRRTQAEEASGDDERNSSRQ
jgi:hypothetical protein